MLTHRRLLEVLRYSPKTGIFRWRVYRCPQRPAGSIAGTKRKDGYIKINVDNVQYLAHRLAWFYVKGRWPKHDIDHRNHKTGDNRISNLRDGKEWHNLENQIKPHCDSTSGFLGVSWSMAKQRWTATIQVKKKHYCLGGFHSAQKAARVYLEAKRRLHRFNTL